MHQRLPIWPRPNFMPNVGDPFLLLAAFGDLDLSVPVERERYRSGGVPDGCSLHLYDWRQQPSSFRHLWDSTAWGLAAAESPVLAAQARQARQFAFLSGAVRRAETLDYLRDAVGIMQYFCDRGATAIFDPHTIQFWSPADWHDRLFAPAQPVPHEHVLILETPDDTTGTAQVHTRGMRKFGRPDLLVRAVGSNYRERVIDLFNYYVEYLASGGAILEGDRITLEGLPPGGVFRVDPRLDHPDFHNAHAEIVWPDRAIQAGNQQSASQTA